MSKIYVYTRVSTKDQADALAQQDRVAMEEAKIAQIRHPQATEIIGPWADKASAFKIPFHQRPMGRLICESVQRGDIVVVSRLDRFVRLGKDFELQFEEWKNKGVSIIFADLKVDMNSAAGGMVARMFAAFAQYFSESLSERQKLAWLQRHVYGTAFPNGNKVLVRKVERKGLPPLTVANKEAIVYLRYIVHRRRSSYRRNGVPDSWEQIGNDLERIRVARGDVPEYRPDVQRGPWCKPRIQLHLKRLMTTELPALNTQAIVRYFRNGLNPFKLGRKKDGQPVGYKLPPRIRESCYDFLRSRGTPLPVRKPKRWSQQYDACCHCGRSDFEHFRRGLCLPCYNAKRFGKKSDANNNGQPSQAG